MTDTSLLYLLAGLLLAVLAFQIALFLRRPDAALLPALSLQGTGSLVGRQASVDARLGAGGATRLALKASAILPQGAAALSAKATLSGTLDAAPFAPLLGTDIRSVAGTLRPDLTLEIRGGTITGSGTVDLTGGAVALPESGLRLSGGQGRLVLQGETLQVQRLAFQTGGSGSVTASGSLRLDAAQGMGFDLAIASRRALLVNRPDSVSVDPVPKSLVTSWSNGKGVEWSMGVEYWYEQLVALRAGYFTETAAGGNRRFLTFGAGLRYDMYGFDFSYINTIEDAHPLANTLRFSLVVDFDHQAK